MYTSTQYNTYIYILIDSVCIYILIYIDICFCIHDYVCVLYLLLPEFRVKATARLKLAEAPGDFPL